MRMNLKFFAIPIFLFAFIALLIHFYPQEANAILSHRQEKVNSYLDSDGNTIEVFNLYVSISGSSEVNHVEGEITLNNLSLINVYFLAYRADRLCTLLQRRQFA